MLTYSTYGPQRLPGPSPAAPCPETTAPSTAADRSPRVHSQVLFDIGTKQRLRKSIPVLLILQFVAVELIMPLDLSQHWLEILYQAQSVQQLQLELFLVLRYAPSRVHSVFLDLSPFLFVVHFVKIVAIRLIEFYFGNSINIKLWIYLCILYVIVICKKKHTLDVHILLSWS